MPAMPAPSVPSARPSRTPGRAPLAVLGPRALNRAMLARQMLLARESRSPLLAIERLVGLQAQAPNPPYLGLWTRLAAFRREQLTRLIESRRVVRAASLRSTLHLMSARDYLALRPLLAPVMLRTLAGAHRKALAGLDEAAVAAAGCALLAEGPLTNAELGERLAQRWPGRAPASLAAAVRNHAALIHAPPAGTWDHHASARLVPAERWLHAEVPGTPATVDQAALLCRYLAAFGPASLADATAWSGLANWKPALAALADRLVVFADAEGQPLYDLARAARPDPDTPAPARLLPEWDNLLLAYADRRRLLADVHRARVFTENGIVRGTVLLDGFVAGVWKLVREGPEPVLAVQAFGRWSVSDRHEVEAEAAALLAFAADDRGGRVRFRRSLV